MTVLSNHRADIYSHTNTLKTQLSSVLLTMKFQWRIKEHNIWCELFYLQLSENMFLYVVINLHNHFSCFLLRLMETNMSVQSTTFNQNLWFLSKIRFHVPAVVKVHMMRIHTTRELNTDICLSFCENWMWINGRRDELTAGWTHDTESEQLRFRLCRVQTVDSHTLSSPVNIVWCKLKVTM